MGRKKRTLQSPAADGRGSAAGRSDGDVRWLTVVGAAHNNLKNVNVSIPLGRFVCVTGVSGSGKSSLVNDILFEALNRDLNGAEKVQPGRHERIRGTEHLDKVIDIDQSPIGRTPRSNPATYIKVFDEIRRLFTLTPEARVRGYRPGRFSFNVPAGGRGGGRCEACEGNGSNRVEMDFLADVWVTCPVCAGRRFSRETQQVHFRGRSIADVLEMDIQEALEHFANVPKIAAMLQTLHDVGLDYMKLGQSSTTLSGGEAQRIKLARELVKRATGRTLYLLDEPTTGLHFADIKRLLAVLQGFVDAGNTVVVIEHNTDVIKTADWIIDLGPDGGEAGGYIVAQGTPEQVAGVAVSYTGQVLAEVLNIGGTGPVRSRRTRSAKTASAGRTHRDGLREISVLGARQHNLAGIDVRIPRERTTVCCGPSGSGKSSFAIDTVYAEGQRRYVESLSAYARQFVSQMPKPRVDHVHGLSPAISIEQKAPARSPRSTVGTVTEVYDYMRVLWARLGTPHCPVCQVPIGTQTADEIIDRVLALGEGTRALVLAPLHRQGAETFAALLARQKSEGFLRVRLDGVVRELDEEIRIEHGQKHALELVVDRVVIKRSARARLADSLEQALTIGEGVVVVQVVGAADHPRFQTDQDFRFSQLFSCESCGASYEELTPHHLSFNTRLGWCERCEGLGVQRGASPEALITHPTLGLLEGAVEAWGALPPDSLLHKLVCAVADRIGFAPSAPWNRLSEAQRLAFLQGGDEEWIDLGPAACGLRVRWRGFFPAIDRATRSSWEYRKRFEEMVTDVPCAACRGSRLRPEARAVRLAGQSLPEVCSWPLGDALRFFRELRLEARQRPVAGELLQEIVARLTFLSDVGLEYLTLHRPAATLSGGESQRIRLGSQIGSGLTGVLYVLDEPTIGLHPRDNALLIRALDKLRDLGNTVLLVEHDREVIAHADHVLDFGPGAGSFGGRVVAHGTPARIRSAAKSLTGQYLSGRRSVIVPSNRRPVHVAGSRRVPEHWLTVHGAYHHNLREIDAEFPLGRMICVTGVSGSGKSSLVTEIVYKALAARLHRARLVAGGHQRISGLEHVDKVINVDQTPIGNSPTSNPATYTGVFDAVRELFARLPDSKVRGYSANRFSFNRPGGRCEACAGAGQRCIEMHFLPDVWVECDNCGGKRYTAETLDVRFKGHSIADVLDLRIGAACELFAAVPRLRHMLQTLDDVGLGYLQLGQAAPTLSGGEAQRVKLAAELGRPSTGRTLYILDEPTTGLHFDDLNKLLGVLHRLADLGNTVICVEHNLDVIKNADWVIDLGPEAGSAGGDLVAAATPEGLIDVAASHTGRALAPVLAAGPCQVREVFDPQEQAAVELELHGPVNLSGDATGARLPWEVDGQNWHLVEHRDHHGQPARWDAQVLAWVVETTAGLGEFAPADWNNPGRVEMRSPGNGLPWFLHALTRSTWLLDVSLRVPVGTFAAGARLDERLGICSLDEREDLPIYGRWSRVQRRPVNREWENIRILLHDFRDVKRAEFRRFLQEAASGYFAAIARLAADPGIARPWITDARNWHISQGHLHARRKTARWSPTLLPELIGLLNRFCPPLQVDWAHKVAVGLRIDKQAVGTVVTNMAEGLRVHLRAPAKSVTPARIDGLGTDPAIERKPAFDNVRFWIRRLNAVNQAQLAELLRTTQDYVRTLASAEE